jgi:hypothetical protein
MMHKRFHRSWTELASLLARVLGRAPLTLDEAVATYLAMPGGSLTPAEVDAIMATGELVLCLASTEAISASSPETLAHNRQITPSRPRRLRHESLEHRDLLTPLLSLFGFADACPAENLAADSAYVAAFSYGS